MTVPPLTPPEPPTAPAVPAVSVSGHGLGSVLVGLQFGLLGALLGLAVSRWGMAPWPWGALALAGASALLGVWALACNRPGNFNVHPAPRSGGHLVQAGPYRLVRHPMYTAVMGGGAACAWVASASPGPGLVTWAAGLCAVALVAVLVVKAGLEERWLLAAHADYAAYRARSWRFLPGLF